MLLDQNIRKKYKETPSLDSDPSLFQQPKTLEVVENLNFSSGTRVKHIDDAITRSVIKTEFMRGPGRCDTSHLSDFNETWSK